MPLCSAASAIPPCTPQTALRLLLRGRSPYDARPGAVSLAPPFCLECLSLPEDVHQCPAIEDLLPEEGLSYLKGITSECWHLTTPCHL